MAQMIYNSETGQYEIDYSDGLPYEGDPFDPNTGQMWAPDLLPPGVDPKDPWGDQGWNNLAPTPNIDDPEIIDPGPIAAPTPTPTSGAGSPTAGGGDLASLLTPFSGQFTPPSGRAAVDEALSYLPARPAFDLPQIPNIDRWELPTKDAVFQDPSFELRRGIGERSLLNNRAAQGLARTGGTLKDLLEYNQGFASSEYGNIANRSLSGWQANTDAMLRRSGMDQDRAKALYEPQFAEYMNKVGAATRAPRDAFDQSLKTFQTDWDLWRDQRDSSFDKLYKQSQLGLSAAGA